MKRASLALLAIALAAGTVADRAPAQPPLFLGGYRVLAVDFHVHSFPFSGSTIAPWDLVLEARRQSLDAIALTGHNQVGTAFWGLWFSRLVGGPTVIVGEEIHTPRYHMIAAGIHSTISWRDTAAESIAEIHRQGGVAIAAHPTRNSWPAFDSDIAELDGAEVMQPVVWGHRFGARDLREFYRHAPLAAIGSSDYHGNGPLGVCRTYVFARDNSADAIVDAVRQHHTVVLDDGGEAFGDPELIRISTGRLRDREPKPAGTLDWISRVCGLVGLLGLVLSTAQPSESNR
jgi:hypothetical protein